MFKKLIKLSIIAFILLLSIVFFQKLKKQSPSRPNLIKVDQANKHVKKTLQGDFIHLLDHLQEMTYEIAESNIPESTIKFLTENKFYIEEETLDYDRVHFLGFKESKVDTWLCRTRFPVEAEGIIDMLNMKDSSEFHVYKNGKEIYYRVYENSKLNKLNTWFPVKQGIVVTTINRGIKFPPKEKFKASYPVDNTYLTRLNRKYSDKKDVQFVKRHIDIDGDSRPALYAPASSEFSFDVLIPENGRLMLGLGMLEEGWINSDGMIFSVFIKAKGKVEEEIFSQLINPNERAKDRHWFDIDIDLSVYSKLSVKLIFRTAPGNDNNADYDFGAFSSPVLYKPNPKATPVIVIDIDTLRADHLETYGYSRPTSPIINRLAEESVVFEQAVVHAPWTMPSQMSILTGLYPATHQMLNLRDKLRPDIKTIASYLKKKNYFSKAITDDGSISFEFGFNRGFDSYTEWRNQEGYFLMTGVVKRLRTWLEKWNQPNLFLFLHTYETHAPYSPPKEDLDIFDPDYQGDIFSRFNSSMASNIKISERDRQNLIARYDGEIHFVDRMLHEVIALLKEKGLYEQAMVIFVSDHGEEFREHGEWFHGHSFYEEMIRAPLIIKFPGGAFGNRRIKQQVEMVDIVPTILDFLNIKIPPNIEGASFMPLISGNASAYSAEKGPFAIIHNSQALGGNRTVGVSIRTETHKLIKQHGNSLFFSLLDDPGEINNIYDPNNITVKKFEEALDTYLKKGLSQEKDRENKKDSIDTNLKNRLKALGYLQ